MTVSNREKTKQSNKPKEIISHRKGNLIYCSLFSRNFSLLFAVKK